jgi:hypothetical protein
VFRRGPQDHLRSSRIPLPLYVEPIPDLFSRGSLCIQDTVQAESGQSGTNQARSLDLKDGFYAVMGGYVVDIPEAPDSTQPGSPRQRSTLTTEGILEIARRGRFPIASKQTIDDKSKADILAKFLVCFQVSFLVIQVS